MKIQLQEEELRQAICAHISKLLNTHEIDPNEITFSVNRSPTSISAELEVTIGTTPKEVMSIADKGTTVEKERPKATAGVSLNSDENDLDITSGETLFQ
jgi:hypothetical protein